jgi:hypothetical protein
MPAGNLTDQWYFVSGVDVLAGAATGGVVALGDSLTDGNISTIDAYCRWPDQLARRLIARAGGRPMAVMNQGLGGNRILHDIRGDSGLRRFDRDLRTPITLGRSIASRITPWAMTWSPDHAPLLPSTMISLCRSSTPAEALARGDHRPRSQMDAVGPAIDVALC